MLAAAPASVWTTTWCPSPMIFFTLSGVAATRVSPGALSLRTAIRTARSVHHAGQCRHNYAAQAQQHPLRDLRSPIGAGHLECETDRYADGDVSEKSGEPSIAYGQGYGQQHHGLGDMPGDPYRAYQE